MTTKWLPASWLQHTDFNLADQILIISKNKITSLLNFVKETIKIMPNYLRQRFLIIRLRCSIL